MTQSHFAKVHILKSLRELQAAFVYMCLGVNHWQCVCSQYTTVMGDSVVKLTIFAFSSTKTKKSFNNMNNANSKHMFLKSARFRWPKHKHATILYRRRFWNCNLWNMTLYHSNVCNRSQLHGKNKKKTSRFLTRHRHKIYGVEAIGLSVSNYFYLFIFLNYDFCEYMKFGVISWKFDILSITA